MTDDDIRKVLDKMSTEDKFAIFITSLNNECILEYVRIIANEFLKRLPEIAVDFKNGIDKFKSKAAEYAQYSKGEKQYGRQ